ncbi:hypothetical protein TNCT_450481 [Trichonephila clavata]|uniref:Uncharacterized protein n=1 Tax=Trichonephila clavata TaxID=2740835 RepID=A0A8X6KMM3_TRICU|nr:hypothetical protein TNCT_450481 [Trichonephila clavata]
MLYLSIEREVKKKKINISVEKKAAKWRESSPTRSFSEAHVGQEPRRQRRCGNNRGAGSTERRRGHHNRPAAQSASCSDHMTKGNQSGGRGGCQI